MKGDGGILDFRTLWQLLLRNKKLILLPVVVVTLAGWAATFLITPQFESSVLIYASNPVSLSGTVQRMMGEYLDLVGALDARRTNVRDLTRELQTPYFVSKIIEQAGLTTDPALEAVASGMQASYPELTLDQIKVDVMAARLEHGLSLKYVTSNHLEMTISASDPYRARTLATSVATVFIAEKERQSRDAVNRSLDFSYGELTKREKDLQGMVDEKSKLDQAIAALERGENVTTKEDGGGVKTELGRRRAELRQVGNEIQRLTKNLDQMPQGELTLADNALTRERKARLDSLIETAATVFGQNPLELHAVEDVQFQIASAEDDIRTEQERLLSASYPGASESHRDLTLELLGSRQHQAWLGKYINRLSSDLSQKDLRVRNLPELRSRREILDQEIKAAQLIRDRFKDQQEVFELSLALAQESNYDVVKPATLELSPVWPNRMLIVSGALLAGLLLGGVVVFLREASDRTINSSEEAESYLGVSVAGVVPKIEGVGVLDEQA